MSKQKLNISCVIVSYSYPDHVGEVERERLTKPNPSVL